MVAINEGKITNSEPNCLRGAEDRRSELNDLLSCPFCKTQPEYEIYQCPVFRGGKSHTISCENPNCYAEVRVEAPSKKEAFTAWNDRDDKKENGFFVLVEGSVSSYFPSELYARLRLNELIAAGWKNVTVAKSFIGR